MKKATTTFFLVFLFIISRAQMEVGYNTTDVGAEFQWYEDGTFMGLHLATNAKLHHSFHTMIGYYIAGDPTASFYYNLNNGGLGVGLGYRYYTGLRPHRFFIGAKADLFTYKYFTGVTGKPKCGQFIFKIQDTYIKTFICV